MDSANTLRQGNAAQRKDRIERGDIHSQRMEIPSALAHWAKALH